jgi:CBS domain-containing protein
MTARDLMTSDPECCLPDTNLREVAQMMVEFNCGEIPVVNNGTDKRPIGVVTDRDIVCRAVAKGKNPLDMTARDCMTSPCVTVTENASAEECCSMLEENKIRRLPVVDDCGRCSGIISQADLAIKLRDYAIEVLEEVSQR